MQASASLKCGPGAPGQAVTEVIVNTAAAIIQQEPTLMLKQLAGILYVLEGSVRTILSKN